LPAIQGIIVAEQIKSQGAGAFFGLIGGLLALAIGEVSKNALSEGLKSGSIAFGLTLFAAVAVVIVIWVLTYRYSVIFREYGLDGADTDERAEFDDLRKRLTEGGHFVPIYNKLMTRALDRVDRFFGDADPRVKTLWPNFFGFQGNKPFWTAPAYDRCLLIALLYPFVVLWVLSFVDEGNWIGLAALLITSAFFVSAAVALGKKVKAKNFQRGVAAIIVAFTAIFVAGSAVAISVSVAGAGAAVVAVAGAVAFAVTITITVAGVGVGAVAVAGAFAFAVTAADAVAVASAVAFAGAIYVVTDFAHSKGKQGLFLISFSIIFLVLCYFYAHAASGTKALEASGFLLTFFGILTLVNAPFDWASIGLTRALLRRGVEAGGMAPLWLALIDLLAATALIVVLAAVMVFAVDLFVVAGRTKIIDVDATLTALADPAQRVESQYWWIYATLFSTLIPSILNVTVAALSLMRGAPSFHRLVAAKMRPGKPMMEIHLIWMPAALAFEVMLAVIAGVLITGWWIFKAVPYLTRPVEWLIPLLQWVAALV
jgi:hypothetical protein